MAISAHRYHSEKLTMTLRVDPASEAVSKYDALKLTDEHTVAVTDTAGEDYHGVANADAEPNEDVGVVEIGRYPVNVANPDGTVAMNTYLVPSGNAGELRPANTGGATGESDGPFKTLTDEDGDGFALLHLR